MNIKQVREYLLGEPLSMERKLQNRHPLNLLFSFLGDIGLIFLFAIPPILAGWGNVWIHTTPEPTAHMVKSVLVWSLFLLCWAYFYCLRVGYRIPMQAMPEESITKHRIRVTLLYGYKIVWMLLTAEASILTIRTIIWWVSWQ